MKHLPINHINHTGIGIVGIGYPSPFIFRGEKSYSYQFSCIHVKQSQTQLSTIQGRKNKVKEHSKLKHTQYQKLFKLNF